MASTEEAFEDTIIGLTQLKTDLLGAAETMERCAKTCASEMGDNLGTSAEGKVVTLASQLRNATSSITSFQQELSSKLEQLRKIQAEGQQL